MKTFVQFTSMTASINCAKASITSMKTSMEDFVEVASMEALVEAFVEAPAEVASVKAFILSTYSMQASTEA